MPLRLQVYAPAKGLSIFYFDSYYVPEHKTAARFNSELEIAEEKW
jgi:hypothetical protein